MSVLIKGMEMPENCKRCLFSWEHWDRPDVDCQLANEVVIGSCDGRPDWCPLVEIQEDDMR